MSYVIEFTDVEKGTITVEDKEVNDFTSLNFPGKGVTDYGKIIAEDMLHLLENFADTTSPREPVEGQLWYDTKENVDQLKIYDGTRWVPASGVFKAATSPEVSSAVVGDLWVDTNNQQLYLGTGSGWVLVGPEFSRGSATGFRAALLTGTDNQDYAVMFVDVDQNPVVIISGNQFRPKTLIDGFTEINPGVNLSSKVLPQGSFKFYGLSESAESLRIQNKNIPADRFLRSDIDTTSLGILTVKNNQGIRVGDDGQLTLQTSGPRSLIRNTFSGAGIDFQVKRGTASPTVLRLNSNPGDDTAPTVGINTLNPQDTLDITGTLRVSDVVRLMSDENTSGSDSGALQIKGGAWVAKDLRVFGNVATRGDLSIIGNLTSGGNVSTGISGFDTIDTTSITADTVTANTFVGFLDGTVSKASKLANQTSFEITGDVTSNTILFDGTGTLSKQFSTTVSNGFISSKTSTTTNLADDEILINRISGGSTGLFRISQRNLVKSVPTNPPGVILPYGGTVAPPGWLLCDGSIVSKSLYSTLFDVIGHQFLDTAELANQGFSSSSHFGLPDFRGRVPLGRDAMGGIAANRVTSLSADTVGNSGGAEKADIRKRNLPAHEHDLKSSGVTAKQYYAIRDSALDTSTDSPEVVSLNLDTVGSASSTVSGIPTSGSILGGGQTGLGDYRTVAGEELGAPLDIMSPFTTVNYIIYTGNA